MKLFLTLIFSFFIGSSFCQTSNIDRIGLHHYNSIVINSEIEIFFFHEGMGKKSKFYINVKTSKSENKYPVSEEKATNLIKAVSKISPEDLIKVERSCLDGSDTEISFSRLFGSGSVKYSVNCLNSDDDKTAWKDYLNAVYLILDLAKLKFSDLK